MEILIHFYHFFLLDGQDYDRHFKQGLINHWRKTTGNINQRILCSSPRTKIFLEL